MCVERSLNKHTSVFQLDSDETKIPFSAIHNNLEPLLGSLDSVIVQCCIHDPALISG